MLSVGSDIANLSIQKVGTKFKQMSVSPQLDRVRLSII